MVKKGIVLAGGRGTRLYPSTHVLSKQLLPVYDKPMIYYPLATLMNAGIREILVITTPHDVSRFEELLRDGKQWGVSIAYAVQECPRGLPDAFVVGERFVAGRPCALILGDNIFHGNELTPIVAQAARRRTGCTLLAYWVANPQRYGVIELDPLGRVVSLEEKPQRPRSSYAITGLYFFDGRAAEVAAGLRPSARGELEITDVHRHYLARGELNVQVLPRGVAWLDTGTHGSLLQAAAFIETMEKCTGLKIGCPEEVAYRMGFIPLSDLKALASGFGVNDYGRYLQRVIDEAAMERGTSPTRAAIEQVAVPHRQSTTP